MRLKNVERGDSLKSRMIYGIIRVASGYRAPDVIRTIFYRKEFFGEHHSRHTQASMRGASEWTVGERELFAAFVSGLNQCRF